MPRKDPVTGCMVMTLPEFLNAEGAKENKEGWEIMAEIQDEMANDDRRVEQSMREEAYQYLVTYFGYEWNNGFTCYSINDCAAGRPPFYWQENWGDRPFNPKLILKVEVSEAEHHQKFNSSHGHITGTMFLTDGTAKCFKYSFSHWSGTRLDPPESDEEVLFY